MGWLEDFLAHTNTQQNALIAAASGGTAAPDKTALAPGAMQFQPENEPQPTGPVGAVHLGRGLRAGAVGGAQVDSPFERYATNRHGKLMEAHDYGGGDIRYFARKNPALLQAAARLAATRQLGSGATPGGQAAQSSVAGMSPEDQERIRRLLGV